jgi:hypothetical protein
LKVTVAIPSEFVIDVGEEKDPPVPVLPHVTTRPAVLDAFWCWSVSCAETTMLEPTTGWLLLGVTVYAAAGPTIVVMSAATPLIPDASITPILCVTPATVLVRNVVDALPLARVSEETTAKMPLEVSLRCTPALVLAQVRVRPPIATGLSSASTSCALTLTQLPATGLDSLDETMYFAGTEGEVESRHAKMTRVPAICVIVRRTLGGKCLE